MSKPLYQVLSVLLASYACASTIAPPSHGLRETGAELVAEVEGNYDPDTSIPSKPDNAANITVDGATPGLDAYTAKLKKKHWYTRSKHKWIAVIHATQRYDRMKLAAGDNYVFQLENPTDAAHAFVLVPGDKSQPYFLLLSPADLAHGNPDKPLIIRKQVSSNRPNDFVLGGCIECPPLGHCSTTDVGDAY